MSGQEQLEELLVSLLSLLSSEQLVDFSVVLQDGTKVKAQASRQSWRGREKLEQQREQARQYVAELDQRASQAETRTKKEAAQERAARERLERMELALEELNRREPRADHGRVVRVSGSEPEAVTMKHPHGGWEPSYNLQLVTEGKNRFIAGVHVTADRNDLHQVVPAVKRLIQQPERVADNGYATKCESWRPGWNWWRLGPATAPRALVRYGIDPRCFREVCEQAGEKHCCPQGETLVRIGERRHHGTGDPQRRPTNLRPLRQAGRLSPHARGGRVERWESEAMQAYHREWHSRLCKFYKTRAERAEFPNLWIKGY